MVPMKDALSKLAESSQKLNEKSESLNKTIEQLEKRLQASQAGVSVWLDRCLLDESHQTPKLDRDNEPDGDMVVSDGWVLGFAKVDGQWRIAAQQAQHIWTPALIDTSSEDLAVSASGDAMPLLKAPRAVRVEAARHLEALIEAIAARAERFSADIDKAEALAKE